MIDWQHTLERKWPALRFGALKDGIDGEHHLFEVQLHLDDLDPEAVRVELYADGIMGSAPVRQEMKRVRKPTGASGGDIYSTAVSVARLPAEYSARVMLHYEGVAIPLEDARTLW